MQRRTFIAALPTVAMVPAGWVQGQPSATSAFPNKAVRLVVPKPAGGGFDAIGRAMADRLGVVWRQPVIVENKPGAADMLAAAFVAKSAGDGHTLLLGASGISQNPSLYSSMPYEPSELVPIAKLVEIPYVLAVPRSLNVSTLAEFVAWARVADPARRSYATIASSSEVLGEIVKQKTGADLTRVRYRGEQPALTDLLGGVVSSAILSPATATRHPDRLKIIAVSGKSRLPGIDASTLLEQGIPDTDIVSWGGIFCPSTVPPALVSRISRDVTAVGRMPEIVKRATDLGFVSAVSEAEEFAGFVQAETEFWKRVTAQFGIKP